MFLMSSVLMALFGWSLPDAHDGFEQGNDDWDHPGAENDDLPIVPLDQFLADWQAVDETPDPLLSDDEWTLPADDPVVVDAGPVDPDVFDLDDDLPPIEPVEVLYLTDPVQPGAGYSPLVDKGDPFQQMFDAVIDLQPPGGSEDAEMTIMMDGKKVVLPRG